MSTPTGGDPPSGSSPESPEEPAAEQGVAPASAGIRRPFATEGTSAAPSRDSDAILPTSLDDNALNNAVGVPMRSRSKRARTVPDAAASSYDRDDVEPPPKSRKALLVVVLSLVVGLAIAALVLLGRINQERYFLACTTTQAVAQQGRSFPPWGAKPLSGAEWRPIALPANAVCKPQQLADRGKLEATFLDLLIERTSVTLSARDLAETIVPDGKAGTTPLDAIAAGLEQALLLSRAPERADQRKQVERMLGDVEYWRATIRLKDASAALTDAARQFDAAALRRPLHASDAGEWAAFLRRLTDDLRGGPSGVAPSALPSAPTGPSAAPQGTALPVEPEPPNTGIAEPASPPDAGIPGGGVLL